MKDSLLHPVVFLLLLILCFVVFSLGYLLYLWDIQYIPTNVPRLAWAVSIAPSAMRAVFIPATVAAVFLLIMRIARRPGFPLLSFLLPLVGAAAALYFGIIGLDHFYGPPRPPEQRSYNPLSPAYFNFVGDKVLYPISTRGDELGPTLIADPGAKPALSVQTTGAFDPKTWTTVFQKGSLQVPVEPRNPSLSREIAPRTFLVSLISDMTALNRFLESARMGTRVDFMIAVGGVVLFSMSCIAFAWLTSWPLLNVFLVAFSFRGLFWLFSLFSTKVASDTFALVVPKRYLPVAPAIGLGALAVLFLIWNILFIRPPARD